MAQTLAAVPWRQVRALVTYRVKAKFRGVRPDLREEAVAEAMADLVCRWPDYPSSQKVLASGDTAKVVAYAVTRGYHKACEYIVKERQEEHDRLGIVTEDGPAPELKRLVRNRSTSLAHAGGVVHADYLTVPGPGGAPDEQAEWDALVERYLNGSRASPGVGFEGLLAERSG